MALSDFLINSDYPIDKVVLSEKTTRSVTHADFMAESVLFTISHDLGFAPLCIGVFSFDNWQTSYAFGNGPYFFNTDFMMYMIKIGAIVESTDSEIRISAINFGATTDVEFRIIGLAPAITLDGLPSYTETEDFIVNSDYNYMKVIDAGTRSRTSTGTSTVAHGLGYAPQALMFSESGGVIRRVSSENFIGVTGIATEASTDTNNLYLTLRDNTTGDPVIMHYRIYADE